MYSVNLKPPLTFFIPIFIGVISFLLVIGPRVLFPTNIAWLGGGDAPTYYLGWDYFRNSPWTFPIGLNPSYGLELSNSIVYSDSNPLLAIFFKTIRKILPYPFQYFGFWLLICFILQAWFGWKLIGLVSKSSFICALGAGLIVFSPPMIWRLHQHIGHYNLAGHFLILAAIYLLFRPPQKSRRSIEWVLLLSFSTLVHLYLMAIVFLIWCVDLMGKARDETITAKELIAECVWAFCVILFLFWQAGYLAINSGFGASGFGVAKMNLLSIFDPGKVGYGHWSYVMPDLPGDENGHEGFNYLGLGVISLIPFSAYALLKKRLSLLFFLGRQKLLFLLLIFFVLFALSNHVAIGYWDFRYNLPLPLLHIANAFRASARIFWPVFYIIIFALISLVVIGYSKKNTAWIISCALIIQIVDTSPGWLLIKNHMMIEPKTAWSSPLVNTFWAEAANRYLKVKMIPPLFSDRLMVITQFAHRYQLKTDAVNLARYDASALQNAEHKSVLQSQSGVYEKDTLYILDNVTFDRAKRNLNSENYLLLSIDGFNILAPCWKKCQ